MIKEEDHGVDPVTAGGRGKSEAMSSFFMKFWRENFGGNPLEAMSSSMEKLKTFTRFEDLGWRCHLVLGLEGAPDLKI